MGLDITVYQSVNETGEPPSDDYDYESRFWCRTNPNFPGREIPLKDNVLYSFSDTFGFRAGSYSGYNHWRRELAKLAGYPATRYDHYGHVEMREDAGAWAATSGPFWELINFADNEGVIGSSVAAKLAKDFADHQPEADAHPDEYFRAKYAEWRRACEMAADNGAIDFH
jgi:hypothetical protein